MRWRICLLASLTLAATTRGSADGPRDVAAGATARLAALEQQVAGDPENLRVAADYRQLAIAAGAYDRAIKHFDAIAHRRGAGPHAFLNLAFAYIDKVPTAGAIRQVYLGRDAIDAATRSIAIEPTDIAYMVRGVVNLYYDKFIFHRTDKGVADLEQARRLAVPHAHAPYVARIYVALGDGYWRLDQQARARQVWQEGLGLFPASQPLRDRLQSPDNLVRGIIAHALDANIRVDTTLNDLLSDSRPAPGSR